MKNSELSAFAYYSGDEKRDMPGLTKREYFAAMAMQGLIAGCGFQLMGQVDEYQFHKQAVQLADLLLAELEK